MESWKVIQQIGSQRKEVKELEGELEMNIGCGS